MFFEFDGCHFSFGRKLHALVLTPTRELAIQVKDHIVAAAKHTGIQTAVVVGGMAPQKQASSTSGDFSLM